MDGGDDWQPGGAFKKGAHEIAPGAVAVDDIIAVFGNHILQSPENPKDIPVLKDQRGYPQLRGFLGEGAMGKADQRHVNGAAQP
ncbi:hypothetical protein SDC9_197319 [bioreactor metagenome]|uniref:Uncharacterized protein n=1 Tax=bioreactor metagenome TaxID=1076179 RepID=A0A645IEK7_9ZZZZ